MSSIFEQAMDLCRSHDFHIGPEGCGPAALIENLEKAGLFRSDEPEPDEVMAFRVRGNNADIINDCFTLGYLTDEMAILDPTYGKGTFWKKHRPPRLVGVDIDPTKSPGGFGHSAGNSVDFTALPWVDGSYDAVVFDPDYKLQGTSSNEGPASSNPAYGMDREYRAVAEQMGNIAVGLNECFRVTKPGGMVLVKCMSQVVSGNVTWQDLAIQKMVPAGARLIDRFWLLGYRKQPTHTKCRECKGSGELPIGCRGECGMPGVHQHVSTCDWCGGDGETPRRQVHARQNASCLLVFKKGKS